LTDRIHVDTSRCLLGVVTLDELRDATCKLDVLETARDLAERVGQDLAMLSSEQHRDFLAVCVDELTHAEKDFGAPRERRRSPRRERCGRRGNGGINFGNRSEIDRAGLSSGRRVIDRSGVA